MQVTSRNDRSVATALIQCLIRPFASQLVKIKKIYDAGSPRLTPPKSAYTKCNIQERKVEDIWIYDITPRRSASRSASSKADRGTGKKRAKRIYYFAGGSWQVPPSEHHFKFLVILAQRLSEPTVISLISCPLAPTSTAPHAFPALSSLYHALLGLPSFADEEICFAGDSSGGNIALALTMFSLTSQSSSVPDAPKKVPHSLLLICPTVNLLHDDPAIKEMEKLDPVESLQLIKQTADAWAGDWDKSDPRLSPGLGAVKVLADHKVRVNGIIAGYDVLSCEAKTFVKKCQEVGVEGSFLIWNRQMHGFPLMAAYHIPEARKAVDWMLDVLEGDDGDEFLAVEPHKMTADLEEVKL